MNTITINANAKINLTLDILGKRPDGYHEVSMIMQSIALHDTVTLQKLDEDRAGKIVFSGDVKGVDRQEDNIAYKAADLFLRTYKIPCGVSVALQKNIPAAAGLAGGSSDAAAVLRGMNELFGLNLPPADLCTLGEKLGSDVPFCIIGGTMLAEGRGEVLTPIEAAPDMNLVLAKPKIDVSTAWAYKNYDKTETAEHPDNAKMRLALQSGSLKDICANLKNVLECVTVPAYPEIDAIKRSFAGCGALAAMMSGSGPTVFAVAESKRAAESMAEKIRAKFDADVFVTKTAGAN